MRNVRRPTVTADNGSSYVDWACRFWIINGLRHRHHEKHPENPRLRAGFTGKRESRPIPMEIGIEIAGKTGKLGLGD